MPKQSVEYLAQTIASKLPVTQNLRFIYLLTGLIALLMSGLSVAGLIAPSTSYPTDELFEAFVANDVVNLFVGLPILLLSMWWTKRENLLGLLLWPGALFYTLYNYLAYIFALPFSFLFVLYLLLITICLYTLIALLGSINATTAQQRLSGLVAERFAGWVLTGLGGLIALRVLGVMLNRVLTETSVPITELALLISDFMVSPAWMIGGLMLWQRKALGYVIGGGLLFQGSMLFVGLIAVLLLQPLLIDTPLPLVDIIVVFAMGFICFIPFWLFIRGILKTE